LQLLKIFFWWSGVVLSGFYFINVPEKKQHLNDKLPTANWSRSDKVQYFEIFLNIKTYCSTFYVKL
jgi:hypothetical protein